MKIGIDISQVVYATGVSTYTRNLVRTLLEIDKENEYILFGGTFRRGKDLRAFFSSLKGNFEPRTFPISPSFAKILWGRFHVLKIENFIGKVDVFHSSDWTQPPSDAFKVTTVHDLVPLKFPKLSHPKIVSANKLRFKFIKKEVDSLIVPSETTRKDLVNLGIEKKRIVVIPEAPDPIYKPAKKTRVERIKKKYRISGKYLLAIGITPRKNTQRIIEAYEKVRAGRDLKLVLVGEPMMEIEPKRGVTILGHIPNDEVPLFYSGAEALVYPSLYEGFGLPILEAFRSKTPVVTSNLGSMKEVAGKSAVLVDPYDLDSMILGISKALKNRKRLVKSGLKRAKEYSWQKTAGKTLKVYQDLVK